MRALLESVVSLQCSLDAAGLQSMVIGGLAVSVWGEPRVTRDVDVKVLLQRESAQRLLDALSAGYTPLHSEPLNSLRRQALLFVRDGAGTRLDLLLAETAFDEVAILRARLVEAPGGFSVRVCSPEDLLIYKLIATRPRDHEDARGIVRRQGDKLDDAYIVDWLRQFEEAFDDSTLLSTYRQLRRRSG